jgi:hypothetical protein
MNRRKFIKRTATGLFVPAVFEILVPSVSRAGTNVLLSGRQTLSGRSLYGAPTQVCGNILCWPMNEAGTTHSDVSGNGWNSTIVGATYYQQTPLTGTSAVGLKFLSGNGTYLLSNSSSITPIGGLTNATISCWVDSLGSNGSLAFGWLASLTNSFGFASSGNHYRTCAANGSSTFATASGNMGAQNTVFYCMTYDGTQGTALNRVVAYANASVISGFSMSSGTFPTSLPSASSLAGLYVGIWLAESDQSSATFADLRVDSHTFTPTEVTARYNAGPA